MSRATRNLNNEAVSYDPTNKRPAERVFHAFAFETIAIVLCAPLFAYIMDTTITAMGALTIMVATIAMMWNYLYNFAYDRLYRRFKFHKGFFVRCAHATLFELGLIIFSVPLAAWWLSLDLVTAFMMDIGMLLFYLPYTVIYNWCYDVIRKFLWLQRQKPHTSMKS